MNRIQSCAIHFKLYFGIIVISDELSAVINLDYSAFLRVVHV